MRNQRLQGRIAAGRFTLPVVIFTCIACWVMTSFLLPGLETEELVYPLRDIVNVPAQANRVVSFLLFVAVSYFLIELSNTFVIIRIRASVQTSLYFLLITACPDMHSLHAGDIVAVAFLISPYFLFKNYQDPRSAGYLLHSPAFLNAGSIAFPQLTYFIPIWLLRASNFQALTSRSFCGTMTDWSVLYWFSLGHAFFHDEIALFYQPSVNLTSFRPIDFGHDFRLWEVITLGYLFVPYMVSSVHYVVTGYEDRIRTRAYLYFLIFLNSCIFLFIMLQPILSMNLLLLPLVDVNILVGHLSVLTSSRTPNLFFTGSIVAPIALFCFNIWTLL